MDSATTVVPLSAVALHSLIHSRVAVVYGSIAKEATALNKSLADLHERVDRLDEEVNHSAEDLQAYEALERADLEGDALLKAVNDCKTTCQNICDKLTLHTALRRQSQDHLNHLLKHADTLAAEVDRLKVVEQREREQRRYIAILIDKLRQQSPNDASTFEMLRDWLVKGSLTAAAADTQGTVSSLPAAIGTSTTPERTTARC